MQDSKTDNTFGLWLREQRKNKGISLRSLASAVEISPTYLSRIENGHEKAPSDRVLLAVAKHLEIEGYSVFKSAGRVPASVQSHILSNDALMISLIEEVANAEQ